MTAALRPAKTAIAYNIPEAAHAVGLGETAIKDAIDLGQLPKHYVDTAKRKPIILAEDLIAWVRNSPSERVL